MSAGIPSALQRRIAALDAQEAGAGAGEPAPVPLQQAAPAQYQQPTPTNVVPLVSPSAYAAADDNALAAMFSDTEATPAAYAPAPVQPAAPVSAPQAYAAPVQAPSVPDQELLIRLGRLEAENDRYRAATAPVEPRPDAPAPLRLAVDPAQLTEDEKAQYAASLPIMRKVFGAELNNAMAPALQHIAALEARLAAQHADTAKQITSTAQRAFRAAVSAKMPDIRAHFEDPRFRQFQTQAAPFTGGTYGDVMRVAWESQDLVRVEEVMSAYLRDTPARVTPDPTAFSQPAASPAPVRAPQANVLLASKRAAAVQLYTRGKLPRQDMARIDAMFEKAESEGRVDHTR